MIKNYLKIRQAYYITKVRKIYAELFRIYMYNACRHPHIGTIGLVIRVKI